nr:FecR protein [uncultured bacterium]
MSLPSHDRLFIEQCLSAANDDRLSADEMQQLASRVAMSDDFARLYVQLSHLDAALRWNFSDGLRTDCANAGSVEFGAANPSSLGLSAQLPEETPNPIPTNSNVDPSAILGGEQEHRSAFFLGLGPVTSRATGWLLFAILLGVVCVNRLMNSGTAESDAKLATSHSSGTIDLKGGGISSLRLGPGTVNLKLSGIGDVIIEGPAQFDMLSAKRARLSTGRIKMRVTEESGRGFIVETPYGEITDLGTEFGIDLTEKDQAGLVVFEGAVDLRVAEANPLESAQVERLVGGEGVIFNRGGPVDRISSIVTGSVPTFLQNNKGEREGGSKVFRRVIDNSKNSRKYYEVVPGGLHEDALMHVDRPHQWNGLTPVGMPSYLVGADYVKTFSRDGAEQSIEIFVTMGCPSTLYVIFDDRVPAPAWLRKNFTDTGDKIGADAAAWGRKRNRALAVGPGESIDETFTIWARTVSEPETIVLGANEGVVKGSGIGSMYGFAAVPLQDDQSKAKVDATTH